MEEFLASLPEEVKKAGEEAEEFMKNMIPKSEEWNGVKLIPTFSKEAAVFAYEHWSPREGDVFVVTFPKSGTHWMCEVVKQVLFIDDPKAMEIMSARGKGVLSAQNALESGPAAKFKVADYIPCRRIYFSHLPEKLINFQKIKENNAKVIYVYRNPKDETVSYFHFLNRVAVNAGTSYPAVDDWSKFLDLHYSGELCSAVPEGEWFPYHIKSWLKHKDEENVLFAAFEDMKQDLATEVRRVAHFLGVERSAEEVDEIVKRCSFGKMKEASMGTYLERYQMFRKGQVGEWKDQFTVAQSEFMDRKLETEMKGVPLTFKYAL